MHIFCRETQAHLDLNPHMVNSASSSNLITPELWLKNCKSRSASPASENSGSPNPESTKQDTEKTEPPKTQKSPLPLITIAPTAKLMKQKRTSEETPLQKSPETKNTRNKMNLRKRRTSKCSATVTSQTVRQRTSTPKAQDLRMCSPSEASSPASTAGNAIHSPPNPINHPMQPPFPNPMFGMPPPVFMDGHPHMNEMRHPAMFPPRMGFMPRPGIPMPERPRLPPPSFTTPFGHQGPPITVLVPYPVVLPLPIPIPIPMPLSAFVQAHCAGKVKTEAKSDDTDGPLDFTMNNKRDEDTTSEKAESEPVEPVTKPAPLETNEPNERLEQMETEERSETEPNESGNPEQTLPKFKITRLGNKMAKIVAKPREPSESTRPLRKRRRLVEATEDDALIPKTRKIVQV